MKTRTPIHILLAACVLASACAPRATNEEESRHPGKDCVPRPDGEVVVSDGWVREQPDAGAMTAAYFEITNCTDKTLTLTGVSTTAAAMVEVHNTTRDASGVVSMAPAGDLEIAPGETIAFEPGGLHAMLMMLQAPISTGDEIILTIQLGEDRSVTYAAEARSMIAAGKHDAAHEKK